MSPLASEADAVRLVEDVIDATSVSHACMCHVPTAGTGAAVVAALVEAGWVAPYSVAEPTEPGAQVVDRQDDTWTERAGKWHLDIAWTETAGETWQFITENYGPVRLARP